MSTEYEIRLKVRYMDEGWRNCKIFTSNYDGFVNNLLRRMKLKDYKFTDTAEVRKVELLTTEVKNIKELIKAVNAETKMEIALTSCTPHKYDLNFDFQFYKGIKLQLINRSYHLFKNSKGHAKRFTLNGTNQNVWIPNKHLMYDGTLKQNENIDYVFRRAQIQLTIAGYTNSIPGIKGRTEKRKGR